MVKRLYDFDGELPLEVQHKPAAANNVIPPQPERDNSQLCWICFDVNTL